MQTGEAVFARRVGVILIYISAHIESNSKSFVCEGGCMSMFRRFTASGDRTVNWANTASLINKTCSHNRPQVTIFQYLLIITALY